MMRQRGATYERKARRYLESQGLSFIAANVSVRGGEIDLIMAHRSVTVFVEVRYRASDAFGNAAASVNPAKQKRLLHAAKVWLNAKGESVETVDCRFDVLAFTGNQIEWLANAFAADT